jgi:hypothetical protein
MNLFKRMFGGKDRDLDSKAERLASSVIDAIAAIQTDIKSRQVDWVTDATGVVSARLTLNLNKLNYPDPLSLSARIEPRGGEFLCSIEAVCAPCGWRWSSVAKSLSAAKAMILEEWRTRGAGHAAGVIGTPVRLRDAMAKLPGAVNGIYWES